MNKPLRVGITGGIGSGKTLVSQLFALLDIPVYNADERAKELSNTILKDEIINSFGTESFKGDILNRDYLANVVFSNKEQLEKLNSIVHPAVAIDFENWVKGHSKYDYVVKEAALLIEAGSYKQLDVLIVVIASEDTRKSRIKKRDVFRTEKEIEGIFSKQTSDEERLQLADYVIQNEENKLLIPQVLDIDKKIRQHL